MPQLLKFLKSSHFVLKSDHIMHYMTLKYKCNGRHWLYYSLNLPYTVDALSSLSLSLSKYIMVNVSWTWCIRFFLGIFQVPIVILIVHLASSTHYSTIATLHSRPSNSSSAVSLLILQ